MRHCFDPMFFNRVNDDHNYHASNCCPQQMNKQPQFISFVLHPKKNLTCQPTCFEPKSQLRTIPSTTIHISSNPANTFCLHPSNKIQIHGVSNHPIVASLRFHFMLRSGGTECWNRGTTTTPCVPKSIVENHKYAISPCCFQITIFKTGFCLSFRSVPLA